MVVVAVGRVHEDCGEEVLVGDDDVLGVGGEGRDESVVVEDV